MRICVITSGFPRYESDYSGIFVYNSIIGLSQIHEIHIVYPTNVKWPEDIREPFHRHPVPYPFKTYPMAQVHGLDYINTIRLSLNMLVKIRAVVKNHNIDLLHAYHAIPSGLLASLWCGKRPLIITLPGSDIKIFGKKRMFKYPIKYALKKAVKIIARSNDLKQEAIKLGAKEQKISIIPAGVDTNKFKPMVKQVLRSKLGLPDGFLMLFVGSLFRIKRVDRLINAYANLNKDFDCHLVIVGDGPEKENLKELAEHLDLRSIVFKGLVPHKDMPFYMAASDVLVLTSESEGLPGCVQEAMASGIPVVTSNVGGLSEIVIDGVNGYLVNNEAEIEECLRLLMSSPHLATMMGANALEFARQNLSLDMVVKQTEELYTSVVAETR